MIRVQNELLTKQSYRLLAVLAVIAILAAGALVLGLATSALLGLVLLAVVRLPLAFVFLAEGPVLVVGDFLVALDLADGVALALADSVTCLLVALAPFVVCTLTAFAVATLLVSIIVIGVMTG